MQETFCCALLQLVHPHGLFQFLGEDLVQLHPSALNDLPLDLGRGFFVPHQERALKPTLVQLVQLLQEDTAAEELLKR